jgi:hypothetical protein
MVLYLILEASSSYVGMKRPESKMHCTSQSYLVTFQISTLLDVVEAFDDASSKIHTITHQKKCDSSSTPAQYIVLAENIISSYIYICMEHIKQDFCAANEANIKFDAVRRTPSSDHKFNSTIVSDATGPT